MTNVTCQISGSGTAARVRCPTGSDAKAASGKARISPKRQRRDSTAEAKFSVLVLLSWLCACVCAGACACALLVPPPPPGPVGSSRAAPAQAAASPESRAGTTPSTLLYHPASPASPAVQPSSHPAAGFGIPNASHSRPRYVVLYTPHVTPSRQLGY
jgi:hypothetical protein